MVKLTYQEPFINYVISKEGSSKGDRCVAIYDNMRLVCGKYGAIHGNMLLGDGRYVAITGHIRLGGGTHVVINDNIPVSRD